MDEKERQEKHQQQTQELYAAIGRFAVKFEHVCHAMSDTVLWALQSDGLQTQRLANAVLSDLTAEPLRKIFGAVLAVVGDNEVQDEKRIVVKVLKQVQDLTQIRNDVIHRTWFVGWASAEQEDFSSVTGIKFKNTNKGPEFKDLSYTVKDFDDLSTQADELTEIIRAIQGCLVLSKYRGGQLHICYSDQLHIDSNGNVRKSPKS
jgi:hypothetical protein